MLAPVHNLVSVNVGGKQFSTTTDTLCSVPGSLVAETFCGDWQPGHLTAKGAVVVDRDGKVCFEVVQYPSWIMLHMQAENANTIMLLRTCKLEYM